MRKEDEERILKRLGFDSFAQLLDEVVPKRFQYEKPLQLPEPLSELEVRRLLNGYARRNLDLTRAVCFLGGGAYDHYIPAAVNEIISRPEFYTAYTPYQAEVSQGTLQTIYEYQTAICNLTGMEVANASMYEAGSALAEAILMAHNIKKRNKVILYDGINPHYLKVVETYLTGSIERLILIHHQGGGLDPEDLDAMIDEDVDAVVIQQPNFFGCLEEVDQLTRITHRHGGLLIAVVDPISLGILKPPGEWGDGGADIVVGEGQSLGIPPGFGGPYLGIFATRREFIRYLPGRLIGMTEDVEGRRGFVMTLQTREQHIRREKATSNICTNEALCALAALVYLSLLGKEGIREVALHCLAKTRYLAEAIPPCYSRPFFKEITIRLKNPRRFIELALKENYLAGIDLSRFHSDWQDLLLIAVTEKRTKAEIDHLIELIQSYREGDLQ